MEYCIQTKNLSKEYRGFKALDSVTMNIPKGAIYGFVGKNGAGKTTLLRLICGLQEPTSGTYSIYGIENTNKKLNKIRSKMGAIIEMPAIYPDLNAKDNLKAQYKILGMPSYEGIEELLELVGLANTKKKRAFHFSLGMKQRLGIAMALCGNPDILILDEPNNGLDPKGIIEIREIILKLNKEKQVTVIISSHILDELSRIATHYGFIDKGKIIQEISASQINEKHKKCMKIKLTDIKLACQYLNEKNIEHQVLSNTEIDVYGELNIIDLVIALKEKNCEILSFTEHNETLETYFMNVVGGEENA